MPTTRLLGVPPSRHPIHPAIASPRQRRTIRPALVAAVALTALAALALTAPSPSHAAFSGSNGKMAWANDGKLMIDDPFDTAGPQEITSVPKAENPINALAPTSAVSFSPDGTKIAFAKAIPDGIFPDHTAIFWADISERTDDQGQPLPIAIHQVSQPYAGKPRSCSVCLDGEATHDHAPVWTPEGDIAYIRFVAADEEAPHASERLNSIRVAAVDGGESGLIAQWNPKTDGLMKSIVWPQGASEPLAIAATTSGMQLKKAVSLQVIAQELGINDMDASPDGSRIAYESITMSGKRVKVVRFSNGQPLYEAQLAFSDAGVRYAPDGTRLILGGCADDRKGQQHCGWKTHRIDDADADVRENDPREEPYLDGNPAWGIGPTSGAGGRSTIDIQSQDLPIIFAPGFLGSEIMCNGKLEWMPELPPIHLEKIALAADGKTEAACPGAAPTGKPVKSFLGADVYGHATDWLKALKANSKGHEDGYYNMGWDWRKSPQENHARLDEQITRLLDEDLPKRQGASRVAMASHSYGSLLIRSYIDDAVRAKRIARVVTIGAPWWGAPKPVFPIAFGIESPAFSALDLFIKNTNLRTFVINAAGAYHLAPSDSYGQWLRFDGQPQDQGGVSRFLGSVGGNEALFAQARTTHQKIDGFKDSGGKIDFRSVTGIGLPTVDKVSVVPEGDGDATVGLFFGQGDGTVPVFSATQGEMFTDHPLGDPVHIQYRCGVPHMRQTADEFTQRAYADFLLTGAIPRRMPHVSCALSGQAITVFRDIALGQPSPRARSARAAGSKSLEDAEFADEIDVIRLPGRTTIVTSDSVGQPVAFDAQGDRFQVAPITDDGEGVPVTYGPVTGRVVLGGTAGAPAVTVDGQPLAPNPPTVPAGPAAPGASGTPGSGSGGSAGSGGRPQVDALAAKLALGTSLRVDAKGRVAIKVSAKAAATGTVKVTTRSGKLLGKAATVRLRKAGAVTVKVTLNQATRAKVRKGAVKVIVTAELRTKAGARSVAQSASVLKRR